MSRVGVSLVTVTAFDVAFVHVFPRSMLDQHSRSAVHLNRAVSLSKTVMVVSREPFAFANPVICLRSACSMSISNLNVTVFPVAVLRAAARPSSTACLNSALDAVASAFASGRVPGWAAAASGSDVPSAASAAARSSANDL